MLSQPASRPISFTHFENEKKMKYPISNKDMIKYRIIMIAIKTSRYGFIGIFFHPFKTRNLDFDEEKKMIGNKTYAHIMRDTDEKLYLIRYHNFVLSPSRTL